LTFFGNRVDTLGLSLLFFSIKISRTPIDRRDSLRQYVTALLHDRAHRQPEAILYVPDVLELSGTGVAGMGVLPFVRVEPVINSMEISMGKIDLIPRLRLEY
jgi:hypothetical protein